MEQTFRPEESVTLLDLLDRILETGVVLDAGIILCVADVDLVYVGLKALLSSVETVENVRAASAARAAAIEAAR